MRNKAIDYLALGVAVLITASCANPNSLSPDVGAIVENANEISNGEPPTTDSPLTEFLNLLMQSGLSQEDRLKLANERVTSIEEFNANCMHEQGFEYALNFTFGEQIPNTDFALWQPDNRDWVAQWGFGEVMAPTDNPNHSIFIFSDALDPNTEIRSRLSPAEEAAWQLAFFGGPDYEANPGCRALAQMNWNNQAPLAVAQSSAEFAPLIEALFELQDTLFELPAEPERDLLNCLADAGYPGIERHWMVSTPIADELFQLTGADEYGNYWDPVAATQGELPAELADLREREIEMALADFYCRAAVDFATRESVRVYQAETQFVADHRSALAALRDAVAQLSQLG